MPQFKFVSVMYRGKESAEYKGRTYTYRTVLPLRSGDIVVCPTKYGESYAKVIDPDLPEHKIDERIISIIKYITKYADMKGETDP